jgi:hypothetical protein
LSRNTAVWIQASLPESWDFLIEAWPSFSQSSGVRESCSTSAVSNLQERFSMRNKKTTLIAFMAVLLTIGALWFTNRTVTPKQATWDDVLAEARNGGYKTITTEELCERYQRNAKSLLLVDTRQEWEYRTGHIKGALNFPIEPTWWSRRSKASALERFLGPDKDRMVVFY